MNLANILILVILISMSFVVVRDFRYTWRKRASKHWPTVEATIEEGAVKRGGPASRLMFLLYRVCFIYSYHVNGVPYRGRFVLTVKNEKSGKELQNALIGKKTITRYDTRHPDVSLLIDSRMQGRKVIQDPLWT